MMPVVTKGSELHYDTFTEAELAAQLKAAETRGECILCGGVQSESNKYLGRIKYAETL